LERAESVDHENNPASMRDVWEERFREGIAVGDPEPWVTEMIPLLPPGMALDVAAGMGRHSLALARADLRVIAVDFSATAMRALAKTAAAEGLSIDTVVADLESSLPFRTAAFDVVVNVNFLERALVPHLIESILPGGMLLFDTFLIDQAEGGHPRDPRFLLGHYELRGLLAGMELIRYREGLTIYPSGKRAWRASALARRK
jgi:tellurite methyltransferase